MDIAKRKKLERRLDRHERSISLWLTRFVAILIAFEGAATIRAWGPWFERCLSAFTDCVVNFIMMRASLAPGYQKRIAQRISAGCASAWSRTQQQASIRALLGGFLRRALKARTMKGRAENLLRILNKRDRIVARMARRLGRGLSRIYSVHSQVIRSVPDLRAEALDTVTKLSRAPQAEQLRAADTS